MNRNRIILAVSLVILVIILVAVSVNPKQPNQSQSDHKLQVAVSFYPLAEFARQVGKDKISVTTIIPAGIEPHEFEPKPQDITRLLHSQLVIYNGGGLEPWIDKTLPELQNNKVPTLKASQDIQLILSSDENMPQDPHIWLDPILAQQIVDKIAESLIKIDQPNADQYRLNAAEYKTKLQDLDQKYTAMFPTCTSTDVITGHNAFGYLAKRYNFSVTSIAGISPEEEPSSQQLAKISDLASRKNIRYIFIESLASPRLSDTIAKEVGAQTLVFNPLEGLTEGEQEQGENYLSIQNKNIENLRIALQCK